jgi:hypothetical protein
LTADISDEVGLCGGGNCREPEKKFDPEKKSSEH